MKQFTFHYDERMYYYKLESFQPVKSFKVRGALNKILTEEERTKGVCIIFSGNHGSSVSYAASLLGIEKVQVIVSVGNMSGGNIDGGLLIELMNKYE